MGQGKTVRTVAASYGAFKTAEMGSWIAITLVAHAAGGVREASLVIAAELLPAAVFATGLGTLVQRHGARTVMIAGLFAQSASLAAVAALLATGAPKLAVYAAAIVAAVAVTTTRPTTASVLPQLVGQPIDLVRANVLLGRVDGAATLLGPVITGLTILVSDSAPFVVFAGLTAIGGVAATRLPRTVQAGTVERVGVRHAAAEVLTRPGPRGALTMMGAHSFVLGCLDLAVVIVAVDVLRGDGAAASTFAAAVGAGMLLGGLVSALMVGRPAVWSTVIGAALATAAALVALALVHSDGAAAVVFVGIGIGIGVLLVASRVALQRVTELPLLAHVFAFAEASEMTMLLLAAIAMPAFVALFGSRNASFGVAAVVVVAALVSARPIARAERARVPALARLHDLRTTPLFAHLPVAALETLAYAATPCTFAAGDPLMVQGEPGDAFHVVTQGHVTVDIDDVVVGGGGPGTGVGELALLHDQPRAATVRAVDDVTTLAVRREAFLLAVTAHPPPVLPSYAA